MVILAVLQLIHCFGWVKRPREFLNLQPFWCQSIPSSKSLPVHLPHGFHLAAPTSFQHFTPNNPTIHPEVSTKILHSEKSYWGDVRVNKNKKKKEVGSKAAFQRYAFALLLNVPSTWDAKSIPLKEGMCKNLQGKRKKRRVKNTNNINDTLYKMSPI